MMGMLTVNWKIQISFDLSLSENYKEQKLFARRNLTISLANIVGN
jgi:hypothetical protein